MHSFRESKESINEPLLDKKEEHDGNSAQVHDELGNEQTPAGVRGGLGESKSEQANHQGTSGYHGDKSSSYHECGKCKRRGCPIQESKVVAKAAMDRMIRERENA
jgi:hypothetical protein